MKLILATPLNSAKINYVLKHVWKLEYREAHADSIKVGHALAHMGLTPGEDKIAIYSGNRYEYDVIVLGGYHQNLANVSLYDTLGQEAVEFILDQIETKIVFVEDKKKADMILKIESKVEKIVMLSGKIEDENEKIVSWNDFLKSGEENASSTPLRQRSKLFNFSVHLYYKLV